MESHLFLKLCLLVGMCLCLCGAEEPMVDLSYAGILRKTEHLSRIANGRGEHENVWTDLTMAGFQPNLDHQVASKFTQIPPKNYNVSTNCMDDVILMLEALLLGKQWALLMLDAFGKPRSGILQGNIMWLGDYSECLQIIPQGGAPPNATAHISSSPVFETQYCVVSIGNASQPVAPGMGGSMGYSMNLRLGVCVPNSCSAEDTRQLINTGLFFLPNETEAISATCVKEDRPLSSSAIAIIIVLTIIGLILLAGTAYDLLIHQPRLAYMETTAKRRKQESDPAFSGASNRSDPVLRVEEHTPLLRNESSSNSGLMADVAADKKKQELGKGAQILLAFSVYTNGAKLLNTDQASGTLQAVHGIRFISMTWVILGHVYVFGIGVFSNPLYLFGLLKKTAFQAVANATVSVDTFFMLSGLLAVYVLCREMEKKGGPRKVNWALVYFHRYWRLTPPYMLLLGIYVSLGIYFANGPMWPADTMDPNCKKYWWANLLYINNLIDTEKMCVAWSWYLSNDMQFFLITPLLVVPLFVMYKIGVALVMVVMVTSFIVTGVLVQVNNYPASLAGVTTVNADVGGWFNDIYIKPWCRVSSYLVGMLFGYAMYKTKCKLRMHWSFWFVGWVVAAGTALAVLYGLTGTVQGHPMSTPVSALYNALNRAAWSAAVGWVCFACCSGYGGPVNSFLSWRPLVPLSRLTYMAYLIHPMVMAWFYSSRPQTMRLDEYNVVYLFLGHTVLSYGLGFMASLAFESPMMGLEKILLPRT